MRVSGVEPDGIAFGQIGGGPRRARGGASLGEYEASPAPGRWASECRSACHFSTVTSHDRHRDRDHQPRGPRGRHFGGFPPGAPCGGARRGADRYGPRCPSQELHGRLRELLPGRCPDDIAVDARAVWDDAVAAQTWEGPPVWVHGDLHPADVVVSDGTLSGIVAFAEMFAGDPAWDLAVAWVLLPAGTATRFFAMYAHAQKTSRSRSIEVDRGASHLRKRPGEWWRVRRSPTTVASRLAPTTPSVEGTSTASKIRYTRSLIRGSESRCSSARVDGVCRPPPTAASPVVKLRLSFQ
ncbi:phosphotransferase [Actinomadura citrea]